MPNAALPDLAAVLTPLLERVERARQPLLVAAAERLAADRYRGWAEQVHDAGERAGLLACAAREEEIARRVEALYADAATTEREVLAANPDIVEITRSLFGERPLDEQMLLQARGERLGAATWRRLAREDERADARATFMECARLEEESAGFLEKTLATRSGV
jgi:rubrerythrin